MIKALLSKIFAIIVINLCVVAQFSYCFAQTASLMPNGVQQFFDNNGNPLSGGFVSTYFTGTLINKNTWKDSAETILNTNPIILDGAGRAIIYGDGNYRQIVKDSLNNLIWDANTNSPVPGGGTIITGDGDQVGTIKSWAGLLAPNQYLFANGQALSRSTFSALFTAITQTSNINCTSGNTTVTGLADTTQIPNGAIIEATCIPPNSTVISTTSTTVTLNNTANATTSATAIFYPYGNGDGSTTFNLPDLRGVVIAGRSNMGGIASSNLTSAFFGSNPAATGGRGGNQNIQLALNNLPSHNHPTVTTLTDPGHNHTIPLSTPTSVGSASVTVLLNTGSTNTSTSTTGITVSTATENIGGSGVALSATLVAGGTGYTNGAQVLTVSGGTCSIQPSFNVTVAGNIVTSVNSIANAGSCTVPPNNPAVTTGGGGVNATLNVAFTAQSISTIQPTLTLNYIIKVTPDTSAQVASGVASLGGMIGAIGCGTGIVCTGNVISINSSIGTVTSIATGTGLTGGPITTTGTISMSSISPFQALGNNTLASAAPLGVASRNKLIAPTTFYYRTDGNDANCSGLTNSAYVSGSFPQSCAFASPQGCIDNWSARYDLGAQAVGCTAGETIPKTFAPPASGYFCTTGFIGSLGGAVTISGNLNQATVTTPIASPGVVNWTGHGLVAGSPVYLTVAGGSLPTGLSQTQLFFVIATGLTANSFEVATAPGGSAVNFTGSSTGTQTGNALTTLFDGTVNTASGFTNVGGGCSLVLSNFQVKASVNSINCLAGPAGPGGFYMSGNIIFEGTTLGDDIFLGTSCALTKQGTEWIASQLGSTAHEQAGHGSELRCSGCIINISKALTYGTLGSSFTYASFGGRVVYTSAPTINLNGFAVTGQRCYADVNGIQEAAGLGATFFPGNSVCTTATGGQLVQ